MTGQHVTSTELEAYVLGSLPAERVDAFEGHCASCDACAAALSGEARLEMTFEQVARRSARVQLLRPVRAVAYGAAGIVAMAAAVLLWVGHAPASSAAAGVTGEGASASVARAPAGDGAILDARNDALDGGRRRFDPTLGHVDTSGDARLLPLPPWARPAAPRSGSAPPAADPPSGSAEREGRPSGRRRAAACAGS